MRLNVKEFLEEAGITEAFYPGKRLVHSCRQEGEYKSHCVVFDWRDPETIRIEVKAGLSGKDLEPKRLKYYPVSFQSPTYVDIEIINDNEGDEEREEESGSAKGKGGSGSKSPKKSLKEMKSFAFEAFGEAIDKAAPELGKIVDMVVMGTQIAAEKFGHVIGELAHQISHAKIAPVGLLAKVGDMVTKYEPPSFLTPKGDETAKYQYDVEKNADIGFRNSMG